ncbi:MAG: hypothetical protein AABY22_07670 [Nanoarchaeota archaeon]
MKQRDWERICKGLSKICLIMAQKENIGYRKYLLRQSKDFQRMSKIKLNKKEQKKETTKK